MNQVKCTLNVPPAHPGRNKKTIWITMWIAWARIFVTRAFNLINWDQLWRRKSDFYLFHFVYGRWSAFAVIWHSKNISTVNIFKEDILGVSKKRYFSDYHLFSLLEAGFHFFTCDSESELSLFHLAALNIPIQTIECPKNA